MLKEFVKLIKNIFSREPFEQNITIEFDLYDLIAFLGVIAIIIYAFLK